MRCEDVRPLLPEAADGGLRPVGEVEVHVASCARCSAELAGYRDLVASLASLRDDVVEPPEGFLGHVLAQMPEVPRRRLTHVTRIHPRRLSEVSDLQRQRLLERVAANERVQHAALGLGAAVVGATAIGLLWWRSARRPSPTSATS